MTERSGRRRHPAAVARIGMSGGSVAVTLLLVALFASAERARDDARQQEETARRSAQEQAVRPAETQSCPAGTPRAGAAAWADPTERYARWTPSCGGTWPAPAD